MTVRIFCDICNKEIPFPDEPRLFADVGKLKLEFGEHGGQHLVPALIDIEVICQQCTEKLKLAIQHTIEKIQKKEKKVKS